LTPSVFFIVFAVGQLFVGPFADAMGRQPFVFGGLAVFAAGSVVCAFASSLPMLIAMAAAPGFSPAIGTAMTLLFGWRCVFVLVAVAGVLVALHYRPSVGETLPPARRRPAHPLATVHAYAALATDVRFIAPALAVSLVIGCLYSFFGAAPSILMTEMGVSAAGLSIFFAATAFVVFGSGLLTTRLARRWGAAQVGMAGLLMALASGLWLPWQAGSTAVGPFMAAVTLFLAGMGLVNPIGTAIALEPFGDRAGIASALLGFLQMGCAAIGTALVGALPLSPAGAFACITAGGAAIAALAFQFVQRSARIAGAHHGPG
jgi:MFS transporter, DHA1 family, multidrug resistance protein